MSELENRQRARQLAAYENSARINEINKDIAAAGDAYWGPQRKAISQASENLFSALKSGRLEDIDDALADLRDHGVYFGK